MRHLFRGTTLVVLSVTRGGAGMSRLAAVRLSYYASSLLRDDPSLLVPGDMLSGADGRGGGRTTLTRVGASRPGRAVRVVHPHDCRQCHLRRAGGRRRAADGAG